MFFKEADAGLNIPGVNAMADDALAPCVAMASAAMTLTMNDQLVLVFHEE